MDLNRPNYFKNIRKRWPPFQIYVYIYIYYFCKSQISKNRQFYCFGKRRTPEKNEDPSKQFLGILDMGSVSTRKHEMKIW